MKIKKLILKNFRAYKDISIDLDSNLNVIIGKNDVGKSTILEAMDIFLEGGAIKIDISDLNVDVASEEKKIKIGLIIETEKDKKYLLDTAVKTTLEEESLLNQEGYLEIYKEWDCSGSSITAKSLSKCFHSHYFNEFQEKPLINFKNSDLKKEMEKRDLSCSDKKINSEIRKSIYESLSDKSKKETFIQIDKEDAKRIWESIKKELPKFFLFQSDRANKDSDKEVQNPLKAITKQAISSVEEKLSEIKNEIEEEINKLGLLTVEKLKEMAPEIADRLEPKITNKPWESLFSFSFDDDRNIPINKRGSGIRRLILLNYFRAEAERKSARRGHIIYAIEEPETSQHPNYQIMLIESLKKLGERKKAQIFITTHTPEIAKLCYHENLILLEKNNHEISVDKSDEKMNKIAKTLGVLPYLNKFSIFVEGVNDIRFLKAINKNIEELRKIADIELISILPLFGGSLISWINRDYLKGSNIKAFYLFDNDVPKYRQQIKEINNKEGKSFARATKFLAIENYFAPSLIEEAFDIEFSEEEKANWKNENIVKLCTKKNPSWNEKDIKNKIHKQLSDKVSKSSLEEIGAWDDVQSWFRKIKEMNDEG